VLLDRGTPTPKPLQTGALRTARDAIVAQQTRVGPRLGGEAHRRHEGFQSPNIALKTGTHVHGMTSNDVVTRLNAAESCHCMTPVYTSPRTFEAHREAT